jgi:signal transduction histidine kinase
MNKTLPADPEVKKAFEGYNEQEKIRFYKIGCWIAIVAMPAGIFLDINIYPHYVRSFLVLRLICSFLVLMLLGLFYTAWGKRHYRILCLIFPMLLQGSICWMIYNTEGASSPYYAGLSLFLVALNLLLPWNFQETTFVAFSTIAIYVVACFAHGGVALQGIFFNNLYFLFLIGVFTIIGSYFTNRLRISEFTSRYELDQSRNKLEISNQKLIEMDKMKSRFFANISHELRTPLTLLVSPLQTLRSQKKNLLDEESREILGVMENNAMRLLKLINDLLDLAKLESGRMEVKKEPMVLETFVKGLAQSIQGTAKNKRVSLSTHIPASLGAVMLDRGKMEKIVLNLLFNALKFTPAGGRVELTVEKEGTQLAMKIKDTGMGISEHDLPFIFDRFWQADSSAQRKYQGTGIGLALVKELTETMGGTVTVQSQLGAGTTMIVLLPFEEARESPVTPEKAQETAGLEPTTPGETVSPQDEEWLVKLYRRAELFPTFSPLSETIRPDNFESGQMPKVLVADDEPDMLAYLKSQLGKHYEILEAVDGNQAVEKARQFLPDLILLDMMMPEKDGIQACRELKAQVSTQAIPVVLLTARADEDTKYAALDAGASDFLTKPFSSTELHVRIKNLIESHQFQRDLARQKSALESALEQLKETEGQLVQNEKMASLGRLSAGIIHEINNPLNYATQALYLLRAKKDRLPEEDRAKFIETVSDIAEGMDRVQRIVSDLRTFTHPKSGGGLDLVEVNDVVSYALRFLGHELGDGVKVEVCVPEGQRILADRNKLIHIFVNLIQNSADALKEKDFNGEKPFLSIKSRSEDGKVFIHVRDNGVGIAPADLDKIYDPFFTTKDVGKGMGLGLSICFRILQEQGGRISVKSVKGEFTEFVLELLEKG